MHTYARNMTENEIRNRAATAFDQAFDTGFLDACCDPVRSAIIRQLILLGKADIGTIAKEFSQDRSVISRHLAVLERSGLVQSARDGRRVFYDLRGDVIMARLQGLLEASKALASICCPEVLAQETEREKTDVPG